MPGDPDDKGVALDKAVREFAKEYGEEFGQLIELGVTPQKIVWWLGRYTVKELTEAP